MSSATRHGVRILDPEGNGHIYSFSRFSPCSRSYPHYSRRSPMSQATESSTTSFTAISSRDSTYSLVVPFFGLANFILRVL